MFSPLGLAKRVVGWGVAPPFRPLPSPVPALPTIPPSPSPSPASLPLLPIPFPLSTPPPLGKGEEGGEGGGGWGWVVWQKFKLLGAGGGTDKNSPVGYLRVATL